MVKQCKTGRKQANSWDTCTICHFHRELGSELGSVGSVDTKTVRESVRESQHFSGLTGLFASWASCSNGSNVESCRVCWATRFTAWQEWLTSPNRIRPRAVDTLWLVVFRHPEKWWSESHLGWHSQYMESHKSHKSHVPNHQPVLILLILRKFHVTCERSTFPRAHSSIRISRGVLVGWKHSPHVGHQFLTP